MLQPRGCCTKEYYGQGSEEVQQHHVRGMSINVQQRDGGSGHFSATLGGGLISGQSGKHCCYAPVAALTIVRKEDGRDPSLSTVLFCQWNSTSSNQIAASISSGLIIPTYDREAWPTPTLRALFFIDPVTCAC